MSSSLQSWISIVLYTLWWNLRASSTTNFLKASILGIVPVKSFRALHWKEKMMWTEISSMVWMEITIKKAHLNSTAPKKTCHWWSFLSFHQSYYHLWEIMRIYVETKMKEDLYVDMADSLRFITLNIFDLPLLFL